MPETKTYIKIEHNNYMDIGNVSKRLDMMIEAIYNQTDDRFTICYYDRIQDLLSRKDQKYRTSVEVRPSKIHGNGIFATEDIPAYTAVTMYPADYVYVKKDNKITTCGNNFEHFRAYSIHQNRSGMVLCGNPEIQHPLFLGHLINDSAICGKEPESVIEYINNTVNNTNCNFYSHTYMIIIITTKDIKKDDELFVAYGIGYWVRTDIYNIRFTIEEKQLFNKAMHQWKERTEKDRKYFDNCCRNTSHKPPTGVSWHLTLSKPAP